MINFVSVAFGFLGGILAWFATNYYGRNLLRFWDQRLEIHKALFLSQLTTQSAGLLQLAAEIDGLRVILPIPLRWCLRIRGYDLSSAANALAKLAELQDGDSYEDADFRVQVQESLCLPVDSKHRELAERYRRLKSAVF
jgi:hypothetical protein